MKETTSTSTPWLVFAWDGIATKGGWYDYKGTVQSVDAVFGVLRAMSPNGQPHSRSKAHALRLSQHGEVIDRMDFVVNGNHDEWELQAPRS